MPPTQPRGSDFLKARQWLQEAEGPPLRSGDALHLAIASREQLVLTTADQSLIQAAARLGLEHHWISAQATY